MALRRQNGKFKHDSNDSNSISDAISFRYGTLFIFDYIDLLVVNLTNMHGLNYRIALIPETWENILKCKLLSEDTNTEGKYYESVKLLTTLLLLVCYYLGPNNVKKAKRKHSTNGNNILLMKTSGEKANSHRSLK